MRPFEVVGIPLPERGFYVVELASKRLGEALLGGDQPRYVSTAVLVTNLSVHFKWGRESSRVWVTHLDDATPAARRRCRHLRLLQRRMCAGGVARDSDGIAVVAQSLGDPHGNNACRYATAPLMVSARTDDDFSFVLSSWNEGIRPYDFALNVGGKWNAAIYHTRARSAAVPRRRDGVDETFPAAAYRRRR